MSMNEQLSDESQSVYLTLTDLVLIVWKGKLLVILLSIVFSAFTYFNTLGKTVYYSANAYFVETEGESQGGTGNTLSGLAGFAGFDLKTTSSDAEVAANILKTKSFLSYFILKRGALPYYTGLSQEELDKMEDSERNKLLLRAARTLAIDTMFKKSPRTPVWHLSTRATDPERAMNFTNWLMEDLNESIVQREVDEAKRSMEFLEKKAMTTSVAGLRSLFFSMIESHAKTVMLADVRKEYVFRTIDPAILPAGPDGPFKGKAIFWSAIFGAAFGAVFLVILDFFGYGFARKNISWFSLRIINKKNN